jgi:hypothetical protein
MEKASWTILLILVLLYGTIATGQQAPQRNADGNQDANFQDSNDVGVQLQKTTSEERDYTDLYKLALGFIVGIIIVLAIIFELKPRKGHRREAKVA